jgi:hypothetical protein
LLFTHLLEAAAAEGAQVATVRLVLLKKKCTPSATRASMASFDSFMDVLKLSHCSVASSCVSDRMRFVSAER